MGGCTPGYVSDTFTSHCDVSYSGISSPLIDIANCLARGHHYVQLQKASCRNTLSVPTVKSYVSQSTYIPRVIS